MRRQFNSGPWVPLQYHQNTNKQTVYLRRRMRRRSKQISSSSSSSRASSRASSGVGYVSSVYSSFEGGTGPGVCCVECLFLRPAPCGTNRDRLRLQVLGGVGYKTSGTNEIPWSLCTLRTLVRSVSSSFKSSLSVWVFYYPPDPPRAALSGGGLAQTPHSAHPYKELRPPGFLIVRKRSERHRSKDSDFAAKL